MKRLKECESALSEAMKELACAREAQKEMDEAHEGLSTFNKSLVDKTVALTAELETRQQQQEKEREEHAQALVLREEQITRRLAELEDRHSYEMESLQAQLQEAKLELELAQKRAKVAEDSMYVYKTRLMMEKFISETEQGLLGEPSSL